jgi:SAM-dependent methyltransferase
MAQVTPEHYRTELYNSVERFASYAHQLQIVSQLKTDSVLEVGPGTFLVSDALKRRGYKVTTCDFDPDLGADVTADVRKLPFKDRSFDLVIACQVLEHIPFDDFETALKEIRRVAKSGAVISLPCRRFGLSVTLRLSGMSHVLGRKSLDMSLLVPRKFTGFKKSHQHYWEIDLATTPLRRVKRCLSRYFIIISSGSPPINKYHYFFTLENRAE